jgi:hypothetical protein
MDRLSAPRWVIGSKLANRTTDISRHYRPKGTPNKCSRRDEEERRLAYYDALDRQHGRVLRRFWSWVKGFFER